MPGVVTPSAQTIPSDSKNINTVNNYSIFEILQIQCSTPVHEGSLPISPTQKYLLAGRADKCMRRNCRRAARLDQTMLNANRSSTGMASAAMKEPIRFAGRYGVVVTHTWVYTSTERKSILRSNWRRLSSALLSSCNRLSDSEMVSLRRSGAVRRGTSGRSRAVILKNTYCVAATATAFSALPAMAKMADSFNSKNVVRPVAREAAKQQLVGRDRGQ